VKPAEQKLGLQVIVIAGRQSSKSLRLLDGLWFQDWRKILLRGADGQ
jgi:hypothetical protein